MRKCNCSASGRRALRPTAGPPAASIRRAEAVPATTAQDGRFIFDNVSRGRLVAAVMGSPGSSVNVRREVRISRLGRSADAGVQLFQPTGSISGRVYDRRPRRETSGSSAPAHLPAANTLTIVQSVQPTIAASTLFWLPPLRHRQAIQRRGDGAMETRCAHHERQHQRTDPTGTRAGISPIVMSRTLPNGDVVEELQLGLLPWCDRHERHEGGSSDTGAVPTAWTS